MRLRITLLEHHDRSLPRVQDPPVVRRDDRDPLHLFRFSHNRERLLRPAQSAFEFFSRLLDTGYVEPSYPADGNDRTLIEQGGGLPGTGEDIRVRAIPLAEALVMIADGRIRDAKTVIGLQQLAQRRPCRAPQEACHAT